MLGELPDSSKIVSEYPYYVYTSVGAQVMVPITSTFSYILIWSVFVTTRRNKWRKLAAGARVSLGIMASIGFTLWIYSAVANRSIYTNYGLAESTRMLREEAQNYAWCRLDPKGLW